MKNISTIYEDDDYILLNKPANLLSIPDRFDKSLSNLFDLLKNDFEKIFVVHRLDKETSGIICFAKNAEAHKEISLQFGVSSLELEEQKSVEKIYLALISGKMREKNGRIELPVAESPFRKGTMTVNEKYGKEAITEYEVSEEFIGFSLVKIKLLTGRTHQIRVHFNAIGYPLAIDSIYGNRSEIFLSEIKRNFKNKEEELPLIRRLTLHSFQLRFFHFRKKEFLQNEAPLQKDFEAVLNQLRKHGK